jgi:hypothetical protein
MDKRDTAGISKAAQEAIIISETRKQDAAAREAERELLRSTLAGMKGKQSGDTRGQKDKVKSSLKLLLYSLFENDYIDFVQPGELYADMGRNFRRRLEPIIEKHTWKGVRDGINMLKKAGSADPHGEQQQWIQQHVDDPAKMLAQINESDQEDAASEPESEVESDGSDIEVVISDDESEELGDEDSSDADSFIASSSSSSDGGEDDDVSADGEHDSAGHGEAGDEEESQEVSGDDGEDELST